MPTLPFLRSHLLALGVGLLAGVIVVWLIQPPRSGEPASGTVASPVAAPPLTGPQVLFSVAPQEPTISPDLLSAGVATVYAFYSLPDMAPGEAPSAVWHKDGKPLGGAASRVQADPQRAGHGMIMLEAPGGKLAPGIYEVELKTQARTFGASFAAAPGAAEILAQPAPMEAVLSVSQSGTARGVGPQGEMLQPTNAFAGTDKIYFVMHYAGAEPGTAVTFTWWNGKTELRQARQEVTLPAAAGWAHAWIQTEQGLPQGTYRAAAAVSGGAQDLAAAEFTIR